MSDDTKQAVWTWLFGVPLTILIFLALAKAFGGG